MSAQPEVLVIGAGPAGLAASIELARLGLSVWLVEQRAQLGGAIYRRFAGAGPGPVALAAHHRRQQDQLFQGLTAAAEQVEVLLESVFIGVDRDGRYLLDNRRSGQVQALRPKAVILALGTVERVPLVDGWELPGVVTVGAMQVQLKETGSAPQGPVLLAGNGPLLLALAAQLVAAGNPPVAVLERAAPQMSVLSPGGALWQALRSPPEVKEALTYAGQLLRQRVPYRTGWAPVSIRPTDHGLLVTARHVSGASQTYPVRHVALHNGLQPNTIGLPAADATAGIVHAGDCREVLGGTAAIADGRRAAQTVARTLGRTAHDARLDQALATARRTQGALAQLFAAPAVVPGANTVICRCEGLRRADFDQLQVAGSARELRLVGRFGMGACQGRFCAEAISDLARQKGISFSPAALNGEVPRWPLRPVSLVALANADFDAVHQREGTRRTEPGAATHGA